MSIVRPMVSGIVRPMVSGIVVSDGGSPLFDYVFASALPAAVSFSRANGTQTTVSSSGLVASVADGSPRFWYNPVTRQAEGLLIEQGMSTVMGLTEAIDSWGAGAGVTVTANTDTAPDGNVTADTLADASSGDDRKQINNSAIANDSATYHIEAFLKKTSGAAVYPAVVGAFSVGTAKTCAAVIDTNNGVVSATSNIDASGIDEYPTFWRVWAEFSNNSTGNTTLSTKLYPAWNTTGAAGQSISAQGSNVFWGVGTKKGPATSYMPAPTSGVVSRADESATFDATQLNIPIGRLFVKVPRGGRKSGVVLDTTNGATTGIRIDYDASGNIRGFINGVTVTGSVDATGDANIELDWSPAGVNLYTGTLVSTLRANSASNPGTPSCGATARLGATVSGASWLNRSVLRVTAYNSL